MSTLGTHLLASLLGTVRHPGIGTGISEPSTRVPIFSFATQGGKASEFLFSTEEQGLSPRGSDPVPCRLT